LPWYDLEAIGETDWALDGMFECPIGIALGLVLMEDIFFLTVKGYSLIA